MTTIGTFAAIPITTTRVTVITTTRLFLLLLFQCLFHLFLTYIALVSTHPEYRFTNVVFTISII